MTVESVSPATRQHVRLAGRPPSVPARGCGRASRTDGHRVLGVSLILNYTFQTSSYDLVIFDEAVRSYARFQPGISVIKGLHHNFGPNFSVLGDHWSPILAALAPLYWIYNSPETLLVAQAVLFALALPSLWLFTRRAFGGGRKAIVAAYLVAVAYGLSWPIASAAAFDFHEVAFAPVLTAVALERLQAGLRTALVALAVLLLVKEDMGLFVAGIGVYLAVIRTQMVARQRLVAVILIVVGVTDTWVATYLLIPALGDAGLLLGLWRARAQRAAGRRAHHRASARRAPAADHAPGQARHDALAAGPVLFFLPLLSPLTIAIVPLLAERMLQDQFPNWWVTRTTTTPTSWSYWSARPWTVPCGWTGGCAEPGSARQRAPGKSAGRARWRLSVPSRSASSPWAWCPDSRSEPRCTARFLPTGLHTSGTRPPRWPPSHPA